MNDDVRSIRLRRTIFWIVSLCTIGMMLILLVPGIDAGKRAPEELCQDNLRIIVTALHSYHADYGTFPPAYTVDANGKHMHSWRTLLLPYLVEPERFNSLRMDEPWDSEHNRGVAERASPSWLFSCRAEPWKHSDLPQTNYLAIVGEETMWPGAESGSVRSVTDPLNSTIMLVEVADCGIDFFEPRDLSFDELSFLINDPDRPSPSSRHQSESFWPWQAPQRYVNAAFADGSVKSIPESTPPETLRALLTINGGEAVGPDFFETLTTEEFGKIVMTRRVDGR